MILSRDGQEELVAARVAAGLTRRDLSRLTGISERRIAYFESGIDDPRPEALIVILATLDQELEAERIRQLDARERFILAAIERQLSSIKTNISRIVG